ncbi:LuxR family transcriptional regulator [Nocardioides sp. zg-1228]|uniref:helix-turn-helix transcriptional regulator n=1 Tax=Nocardioides sp. zg-1228 TaxID=2763008 RepID=UPI001642D717|nr:LuxR family transcriptional regulator [Nocardioides sp. zg-1228]MBC2931748.1 hypothetical protein [Nocardioides sp. zg-1228]QSF57331.1 hypothetical protein JX575_17550 [Nocardioides sp. zg-1228]
MRELLGRATELESFAELLGGPEGALLVHGEAGVGKTALTARALAATPHRVGGALGTLAWLPFLSLRRALPELPDETWTGDPDYVATAIEAAMGSSVLVVEDAQWADPATLEVLEQLVGRVRLVVTARRGDPAAAQVVTRLDKAGAARLDLEPLGRDAARALVAAVRGGLTDAEVDELVERSGGNPLFIEELGVDGGTASLELALLARCRDLPEAQLEGVALLALAGRPVPATDVPDVPGLLDSGLVVVDADGGARIRHALIGEVIGDLVSSERRVRCHRTLARLSDHPGDVAHHLLAAGDRGEAHAAALRAVEQSATPGERWRHLVTAAESADGDDATELRIRAAEAACTAAEPERAGQLLEGLEVAGPHGAALALARATQAFQIGDWDRYPVEIAAGRALARPGSREEAQLLNREAAAALIMDNDARAALALAREAIDLAARSGTSSAGAKGMAASALADLEEPGWRELFEESLVEARAEGDAYRELSVLLNYTISLTAAGDLDEALAQVDRHQRRARELRLLKKAHNSAVTGLVVALYRGDLASVVEEGSRMLAEALAPGDRYDVISTIGFAQAELGHTREALAAADALKDRVSHLSNHHGVRLHAFALGGQPERAVAEWEPFTSAGGNDTYAITGAAPVVAWAAYDGGLPPPPRPESLAGGLFAGTGPELDGIDALRSQQYDAARGHFDRAGELHGQRRSAVWMCRWAAAEATRLGGDTGSAEAELRAVLTAAREDGLAPLVARCERSLRAAGVHQGARRTAEGALLSAREQEVVDLVAEGLTDREIATRLALAHRTVQTHLASARRKLGADNRSHLVAILTGST